MFKWLIGVTLALVSVASIAQQPQIGKPVSPSGEPPKWEALGRSGVTTIEVNLNGFDYMIKPADTVNVMGEYRLVDKDPKTKETTQIFWTDVKTCAAGHGKLTVVYTPGTPPQEAQWSKDGRSFNDVVGVTLCQFHDAVTNTIKKIRKQPKVTV